MGIHLTRPLILALAAFLLVMAAPVSEPRHAGRSLSQWLVDYRYNLAFPDQHRSGFTDEEIDAALEAIGQKALPYLVRWLQAKDSPLQAQVNALLDKSGWTSFRFAEASEKISRAVDGFMFLGTDARPAEDGLVRLTLSPDPELRGRAYCAFYFTRPEKHVFLPVAYRALKEPDSGTRLMTAQWFVERFPLEAQEAGAAQIWSDWKEAH